MLTKQSFTETIKFNAQCDLQGQYIVEMDKFFPINLEIRNLKEFKRLISNIKFAIVFEEMPVLKVEMKDSILKGVENLTFDMNYAITVDVMNKNPLQKHKGGTLFLKRKGNTMLNKKIPLKF